jgi:CelD/BcsL family acetyltransferase involved in cellulose biosynthesis
LSFIYGGLLGSPDSDVCRALAGAIRDALRNGVADAAFFNHLGQSTPLYKAMMEQSSATTRDPAPLIQTHRRMVLPTSAEAFWAGLSSKVRKNQRWQLKKLLSDLGDGVQICCFSRAEEVEHMSIDVEGIAKTTYQRGLNAGFVDSPDMRSRLALRAAKGWLRGYVLYIGGEPQAFWLGTLYRGTFHSDYMGYAARYAKYSPGMCLVMRVIEELCSTTSGVESIDFGLGDAQYKQILGNRESQDVSVYFFASNMRGLTLNALRTPIIVADRMARGVLEKGKWVSGVKRFWRRSKADAAVRQTNQ